MGIKGTVKRSTDGDFIHANVDIDLIIEEEKEYGSKEKPVEIFHMVEHFCLGRRRLHLFGRDDTIRPGWLTLGDELTSSNYDRDLYSSYFNQTNLTTGCTEEIERLRPKSPTPKDGSGSGRGGRGGRGRGSSSSRGASGGRGRGEHRENRDNRDVRGFAGSENRGYGGSDNNRSYPIDGRGYQGQDNRDRFPDGRGYSGGDSRGYTGSDRDRYSGSSGSRQRDYPHR